MSSRLMRADDACAVEPMVWRNVQPGEAVRVPFLEQGAAPAGGGTNQECVMEQRVRDAHAAGLKEGEASGQRRASAELQPVVERLCRSIEEVSGLRARLRSEAERDLVQLALAIARRILGRELAIDPGAIHGLVLGALDKMRSEEICRVRVHPAQQAAVAACLRQIAAAVEVVADPACGPGAVVFETERGNLDASVESQLQEIERGLADRLRRQA